MDVHTISILIVEDDPAIAAFLQTALECEDFSVKEWNLNKITNIHRIHIHKSLARAELIHLVKKEGYL